MDLEPGDVLLIPPGLRHAITWLGGSGRTSTRHGYVHFAAGQRLGQQPCTVRATRDDPLAGLGAYLLWLGSSPDPDDGAIRRTVEFMLDLVLDFPKPHLGAGEGRPVAVARALACWREAWAESPLGPVSTSSMAAAAHVSVAQLNRLFGRATGSTPAAAVSRLRCARAEDLLANTDLSFTAIARLCGYADAAHFSHRFRTLHGVSPRAYRMHGLTESVLDEPGIRRISHLVWHQ